MENMQLDGKSMLIMPTLDSKRMAVVVVIGKKDVQMETKIGGDGVMETVEEKPISAALKQP